MLLDVAQACGDAGDDWFAATAGSASGDGMGNVWARGIEHGPDERFEKLADVIAAALASARQQVWILTHGSRRPDDRAFARKPAQSSTRWPGSRMHRPQSRARSIHCGLE